ncbi:RNA-binding protein Rsf1-like [Rhipicephalus microplus]|uniref:RNA-binding protein Rsf1-like n=1 Tax=Rhipicephalus microplus TaxID=6941 RepID=UPI003F6D2CCA
MTHDDPEREFGKYGQHNEVRMAQNSPGFVFLEFENMSYVDEEMREMNGAIVNGVLLRVERARQKSRWTCGVADNGGAVGPFRPRLRSGGSDAAMTESDQQADLERRMIRRAQELMVGFSPQETMPLMQRPVPQDPATTTRRRQ